jgi:TonB family protein
MLLEKQKSYPLTWFSIGISVMLHALLLFVSFPKPPVDLNVVMSAEQLSIPISLEASTSPMDPVPSQKSVMPKSPPPSKTDAVVASHAPAPSGPPTITSKVVKALAGVGLASSQGSASGVGKDSESVPGDRKSANLSAPISPTYPKDALAHGWSGEVRLLVQINEEGRVVSWKVDKSSGHDLLDQSFIRAVRSCRWEPKRVMGKNVPDSQFLTHVYQI